MYVAGLVIAILALLVGLVPLIGWLAVPANLVAIGIGFIGYRKKTELSRGKYQMAVAAIILGAIPLILKTFTILALAAG